MTVQLQQVGVQYWFRVLLTALFLYIVRVVRYTSIIRLVRGQSLSIGS